MQGVSARYAAAIAQSHDMATTVEVLDPRLQVLASIETGSPSRFAVQAAGGVVHDGSAAIRRRGEVTLVDPDGTLTPVVAEDLFSNLSGNKLRVRRGIRYEDGSTETLAQGILDIAESDSTRDAAGLLIRVTAYDQARALQRAKWTAPYYVQENQNYVTAIEAIVHDRLGPAVAFRADSTPHLTPFQSYTEGSDPLDVVIKMAAACGMEVFVDFDGVWVIRRVPDPAITDPVWRYLDDVNSMLLKVEEVSSNERVFNGQIVIGDSSSGYAPARAEVWDTNPASPTYYLGPYGKVPNSTTDPLVLTDAQAMDSAQAKFRRMKGFARQLDLEVIPTAAHDFLDVVEVASEPQRVDMTALLETWTVPLSHTEQMPVTTRERIGA